MDYPVGSIALDILTDVLRDYRAWTTVEWMEPDHAAYETALADYWQRADEGLLYWDEEPPAEPHGHWTTVLHVKEAGHAAT